MHKLSTTDPPSVHKLAETQNLAIEFPLDDATLLQNPSRCPCNRFNWNVLKSLQSALKLGQIIAAIVILALTYARNKFNPIVYSSVPEITFVFFTINTMAVTVLMLGDSLLTSRPLRKAFTPVLWFQVELWFTGLAAGVFHVLAYYVLIMASRYQNMDIYRVASAFGFVSGGLYLVDWWLHFSKRLEIVQKLYLEVDVQNSGRADNFK